MSKILENSGKLHIYIHIYLYNNSNRMVAHMKINLIVFSMFGIAYKKKSILQISTI